ncbi:MAG TPA: hypothetical protein VJB08_00710 [Candidatus Nanoarchaeia archaeon]|nr:hypothetical protein [Candidatus Nanoarchaeia archaeon]
MPEPKIEAFEGNKDTEMSPESIQSSLKFLTQNEQAVLFVLHDHNSALTTHQIRNYLMDDAVYEILKRSVDSQILRTKKGYFNLKSAALDLQRAAKKKAIVKSTTMERKTIDFLKFLRAQSPSRNYLELQTTTHQAKESIESFAEISSQKISNSEKYGKINRLLSENGVEIPSFRTLNTVLERLTEENIIKKRVPSAADQKKKRKIAAFWVIHPKVDMYLNLLETSVKTSPNPAIFTPHRQKSLLRR